MVIVECNGGSRRSFIYVPEEVAGKGWRTIMEVLWDFVNEGRGLNLRDRVPMVVVPQPQHHSYREALEATMKVAQPCGKGGGSGARVTSRGASTSLGNGQGHTIGPSTVQGKGGGGRCAVSLAEGSVLSTLLDVKDQHRLLQDRVDFLI